ncbi:MAG: flavodoxin-dependent (E)-4-hydroxy-3-methylbut-2-enyl-diphosphate synthase [Deltaproteobacteria bacterium]|nr:flavodoxin-dependent (E)-4-hydroxy-3-methylbut-2-enyl-diphosphate synthase [Deltaproteobacteria bacterium]
MGTKVIRLGGLSLGGGNPVIVQTMANTDTRDVLATLAQVRSVAALGAEIVRVAVPDMAAARAVGDIVRESPVPIVADVHFDWRLAVEALRNGAAGVRVNPGNIGGPGKAVKVAEAAGKAGAALRVGVNMGSLDRNMAEKYGRGPRAMVESALLDLRAVTATGFDNLKVSLKASSVLDTIEAARLFHSMSDIPQHLGVTEAGDALQGTAKSAVALGILLSEGIGDTIRVSLTGAPEQEVVAAWEILRSLGLRQRGVEYVSCPTCGRCEIDLAALLEDVKARLKDITQPMKIAVMGCVVNGPGEARDADAGIAGGKEGGSLFVRGRRLGSYPFATLAAELEKWARALASESEGGPKVNVRVEGMGEPMADAHDPHDAHDAHDVIGADDTADGNDWDI